MYFTDGVLACLVAESFEKTHEPIDNNNYSIQLFDGVIVEPPNTGSLVNLETLNKNMYTIS